MPIPNNHCPFKMTAKCGRRVLIVFCVGLLSGCGYIVGNSFPTDVRTISVPVFTSESFRRDAELLLTEAVHKEIQKRTPFRLVNDGPAADRQHLGCSRPQRASPDRLMVCTRGLF